MTREKSLHDALRKLVIHNWTTRIGNDDWRFGCSLCGTRGTTEQHKPGCLAAPMVNEDLPAEASPAAGQK